VAALGEHGEAANTGKEREMSRTELVGVALGHTPADVAITGGRLVNVASGEIYDAGVAIKGDRIAAVGDVDYTIGQGTRIIDATGHFLCPGLIEAHLHSYHSSVGVREFAEALLCHGVTTYVDGFYGQGIVGGKEAVRFFKDAFDEMPVRLLFLIPALAYLQNRDAGLTPAPGVSSADMMEMLDWPGCYGVEEPPPASIVGCWPEMVELYEGALARRLVLTGHAAAVDARTLQAYTAMGTTTDHEAVTGEEGRDRIRAGYSLFMRMASAAWHEIEVVKAVTELGVDSRSFGFCADEASPTKLTKIGTTAHNLRTAISRGVAPITAVQMATLNNAQAFFAQTDVGQIAAGRYADILLVDDLVAFNVREVIVGGVTRVRDGILTEPLPPVEYPSFLFDTVKLAKPVTADDLRTPAPEGASEVEVRAIGVIDGGFLTDERRARLSVVDGFIQPDVDQDVIAVAMVDRFGKGLDPGIGVGFAQGYGIKRGCIASTLNAVCENVIVAGVDFDDMALACNKLAEIGGGLIVVEGGEVKALVELPLQGLMNDEPLEVVMPKFEALYQAVRDLGCDLTGPFVSLEFTFVCPGIPDLKLSDEGLMRIGPTCERLSVVVAEPATVGAA
jgi:adenine deaminase